MLWRSYGLSNMCQFPMYHWDRTGSSNFRITTQRVTRGKPRIQAAVPTSWRPSRGPQPRCARAMAGMGWCTVVNIRFYKHDHDISIYIIDFRGWIQRYHHFDIISCKIRIDMIPLVGGLEHVFLFSHILGSSSSQLTSPHIFQMARLNHQII